MRMPLLFGLLSLTFLTGCEPGEKPVPETPVEKPKPVEAKKTALNEQKTLFLEVMPDGKRRVLLEAAVCYRDGALELLLCRKGTKEHEAILHADIDAQKIHAALLAAGAKSGSPIKYTDDGRIIAPTGTPITIALQYEKKPGEVVTVDAKEWIRHWQTKKPLDRDWVFAGSGFWKDEDDPKAAPYYLANNGNVISISNFHDAMLDLPIASSKDNDALSFQCSTERIPKVGTKVMVILELGAEKK